MPELPEVETVRRGLEPAFTGARIEAVEQRRRDLRFPFPKHFAKKLAGRTLVSLGRRAKYLLADIDGGDVLVMHLGMTGRFTIVARNHVQEPGAFYHETGRDRTHDHVVFHLSGGTDVIYNDARRFGFMLLVPRSKLDAHPLFKNLGIEPLGNELSGETLARLFAGKKAPLKAALLDQRLIAGLGNIYVSEALHRAGLSPKRAAGSIAGRRGATTERAERLAVAVREVLTDAVTAGGSTLRDYARTDGSVGEFQHSFRVYDREGETCETVGCGGRVRRVVQAGRSSFYCARCQK
jgi:formamidopyrimidine-DNA glycosylase